VRPGREADPSTPSSAEVKNRVQLYLYSPEGPSWPMKGWNLPILFRWLSVVLVGLEHQSNQDNRQSSKKNNKYQLLYTYGCTSWWWAQIRPKHVEVDEIY